MVKAIFVISLIFGICLTYYQLFMGDLPNMLFIVFCGLNLVGIGQLIETPDENEKTIKNNTMKRVEFAGLYLLLLMFLYDRYVPEWFKTYSPYVLVPGLLVYLIAKYIVDYRDFKEKT